MDNFTFVTASGTDLTSNILGPSASLYLPNKMFSDFDIIGSSSEESSSVELLPELDNITGNVSDFSEYGGDDFLGSYDWTADMLMRYSPSTSAIYCIAYTVIFMMGIVGNSFVVAVVLRNPRMRTVTNYFIVNLALADILVLLFCLPATLLSNLFIPWMLGKFMCKAVSYLQGVAVSASINTLVAVSADRFLAICYPLKCQMSRKSARRVIIVIWLFSLTIAFPWVLYFTLNPIDPNLPHIMICAENWPDETSEIAYFVIANLCLCYLIPLFIITACYLAIWFKVWKRNIPGACEHSNTKTGKHVKLQVELVMQRSKLKVAKMMVVVVVIFVISWLPLYCIFARVKLGGPMVAGSFEERLFMVTAPIAQWLGASNSCINPVLYAFFNKKYRTGFMAIIRSRKCCGVIRYEPSYSTASNFYRNATQRTTANRVTTRHDTQYEYFNSIAVNPNQLSLEPMSRGHQHRSLVQVHGRRSILNEK